VLRGPTAKDLAFLAGRHLTYYRPEYHVLVYYPTREELTNLLLAAVQIAMPEQSSPSLGAPVRALHARMERRIGQHERAALADAVSLLDARGGRAALGAWIRSVELTAARVGLVLCGDLGSAASIVRSEARSIGGVPAEAKRGDLVAFCASRAHAALRVRFATTAPESLRSPPTASGVHVVL
jgi:golgin subfamily B member 1